MKEHVERIEDCDGKQVDALVERVDKLVKRMRGELYEKIKGNVSSGELINSQCPLEIIALFLKTKRSPIPTMFHVITPYKTNIHNIQSKPDECFLVEQNLWALYLWDLYARRETIDDFSFNDYDNILVDCFSILEGRKNPCMCLMLWLFPKLVTKDRIKSVEDILRESKVATWWLRDKMLFWLACMENENCSQEKVREIEEQIRELQLDSGAFATVEGKKETGDLISSAIGLLVLISCAMRKDSDGIVVDMAQKTVRWIVEHDVDESNMAWVFYALSEYVACSDSEELTEERGTVGER